MAAFVQACSKGALQIELPELSEGRAAAVSLEVGEGGRLDRVEYVSLFDRSALEQRGGLPFEPEFPLDADARVSLLEYEQGIGLEDLGYPSGELERGADLPLNHFPARVRELRVVGGEAGVWQAREDETLDGPLAAFRFADQKPTCACFTGRVIETRSSTSAAVFLAQVGERRVIVGAEDGRLYRVKPELPSGLQDISRRDLLPFSPLANDKRPVGGGIGLGEGRFVVTDYRGIFWRYELDEQDELQTVREVGRWPEARRVRWLVPVGERIFGLDGDGMFASVDLSTGQSEVHHVFPPAVPGAYQHGTVAYSASRAEVVVGSVHSTALGRFNLARGTFRLDDRFPQEESLGAATFHPELGWFVGTTLNGIVHHEYEPDAWNSCSSQLGNSIGAMVPFRDGFIAGSTQGFIEQYSARDGWCQKLQPASNSVRFMVPFATDGTSFVVTGPLLEERPQLYSTVTLLEDSPQADCNGIRNPGNDPLPMCLQR